MVEAVITFGSGVAGLSVLTNMHTPPQWLTSQWRRNLHTLSKFATSRFRCSSPCMNHLLFASLTHRYFSWFFQLMQRAESRALLSTVYCAAVVLSRTVCFIVVSLRFGTDSFILTPKKLLVSLTHSKMRAVLPLSPTISCRESFHA